MQNVLDNVNANDKKNHMLQPLFRELKSQIRHLSLTPEMEIIREFVAKRTQLNDQLRRQGMTQELRKKKIQELTTLYGQLLHAKQKELRGSNSK